MNVLSIGNSFSQDATRYLAAAARAAGKDITTVNLCIGGCSLSRHYRNILKDAREYTLEVNGINTGFLVSLKEALLNRDWDVVTLQQVSHESARYETYQPYLEELAAYVRRLVPHARVLMHQTWAYEAGSHRLCQEQGYARAEDMMADVRGAYRRAAESIGADGIIPSGDLMARLLEAGIPKVHRDTFHATLGLGRYALALLWLRVLTGCTVTEGAFSDWDEPISPEELAILHRCVAELPLA